MAYVTYLDVIRATPDVQWHADHYQQLTTLIGVAGELVDRLTRRYVPGLEAYAAATTASARTFTAQGGLVVPIDECVAVSAVAVRWGSETAWTTLASTDYVTWPFNTTPIMHLEIDWRQGSYSAWPAGYPQNVQVTARWGYSSSPPTVVEQAVVMQVVRWWRRGAQMFADASPVGELGAPAYTRQLDPEIQTLLIGSGLVKKQDMF